jgi:glycosyltransferase involved in cell wall biosynthesis
MLSKKRILHLIDSGGVYGAERVILNLSQEMILGELYTPVIGCIVNNPLDNCELYNVAIELGLEAHKIPIKNSRLIIDIGKARAIIKKLDIALMHSHGYKPSVFGFFMLRATQKPIIVTCHSIPYIGPLKMRAMLWIEKKLYRYFDYIVAVSEPIKATLIKYGVENNKIVLIQNGVSIPTPRKDNKPSSLRTSLGLSKDSFCILNIGRLVSEKSQQSLVQAAKILRDKKEKIKILIAGEGPLRTELEELIERDDLSEYVSLLGFRDDGAALLDICDAFAFPSISEGMPMALLEAVAANRPIITTLVGDIEKLIVHQKTGYVIGKENPIELVQAILELRNNPMLAHEITKNARELLISKYSSKAMYNDYSCIYSRILD